MKRAGSTAIDLRLLPWVAPRKRERIEREPPPVARIELPGGPRASAAALPGRSAPAPSPNASFDGLDFANWGAGHPPDPNGDVGPTYYIQTINTSIGIYRKSDGVRVAAFTFDTFMSQGSFGNLCDTDNFGDPVVLYDTFEDRWVITDFAFQVDASGNVIFPPGAFQCFAVSKTGDPVSGGWNFYSINTTGGLGDYPKFGIWPDGIYMSANMFDYAAAGSFQDVRVYAFNKAQMYAGAPTVQVVSFDAPSTEFTLLPANARLQEGTPPAGSPNYYAVVWQFLNAVSVYKFHVDWNSISTSTFTGPFVALSPNSWVQFTGTNDTVPSPGNALDTLSPRLMVQNQYSNEGGVESLWDSHTVGASGTASSQAAVRYYQTTVTGGTVASNTTQAFTYSPDASLNRFMPSVAVDRAGNLAIGYSTTNGTTDPAIKYAGNLASDPLNAITQTEVSLINGTGTQTGNCGGGTCTRWGDYSAMTLDPDGCTFWYTNMYYAVDGLNYLTRFGSFAFPACTAVGTGTVQGTVTALVGGAPIAGATVALGSRTTTTDASGSYSFSGLAAGTYPSITASAPGYNPSSVVGVVVTTGGTTTENFALSTAPLSGCLVDTSQADFQTGVPTRVDLTTSPGNAILLDVPNLDQHADDNGFGSGYGFSSTSLIGQTFTPAATGALTRVDAYIFCASCSGTNPSMTLEVRTTSGGLPVMTAGGLLASSTIAGTSSGSGGFFTFSYGTPPTLTAGTQYGIVIRLAADRVTGTQAWLATSGDVYAGGSRVTCTTSSCSNPVGSNKNSDLVFRSYMDSGYPSSGDLISSPKDSNPPTGDTTQWSTLSWTASVPGPTSLKFQVAASNSAFGPFNFVGPDGTATTFFTSSGASLSQFNGNRYLEYRAYLATSDPTQTPTLNDVTVCYADVSGAFVSGTKTVSGVFAVGSPVTYTVALQNTGGSPQPDNPGNEFTDVLPAQVALVSAIASSGATVANTGTNTVTWNGSIAAAGSVTITITATIQ
ncbi:MAG: carboxypeptidase regulatory-like domain-containing protein, partial [Acidobacteriota bacterium]